MILEDILRSNLDLVVCGSAVGRHSAMARLYYAGPGNKFWRTLTAVGLTPRQLDPSEYQLLPDFGIGLTDLVKSQSGSDDVICVAETERDRLRAKILSYQPLFLCFNGKRAAREFLQVGRLEYGVQPGMIGATALFVAPSTSAAASALWDLSVWQDLATRIRRAKAAT